MASIVVQLPTDRTTTGTLVLQDNDGRLIAGPFPALGKADNKAAAQYDNADRDPTLPYGDTPTGKYDVIGYKATGNDNYPPHKYGTAGAIVLDPVSGDALEAKDNGRTGLMIHSGDLSDAGDLRPTNGCVRLSPEDMLSLMNAISRYDEEVQQCSLLEVDIQGEGTAAPSDGYDAGDPPPSWDVNIDPVPPTPASAADDEAGDAAQEQQQAEQEQQEQEQQQAEQEQQEQEQQQAEQEQQQAEQEQQEQEQQQAEQEQQEQEQQQAEQEQQEQEQQQAEQEQQEQEQQQAEQGQQEQEQQQAEQEQQEQEQQQAEQEQQEQEQQQAEQGQQEQEQQQAEQEQQQADQQAAADEGGDEAGESDSLQLPKRRGMDRRLSPVRASSDVLLEQREQNAQLRRDS